MRKIIAAIFTLVLIAGICNVSVPAVHAEETTPYTVECSDEENLATNKYNWLFPTLNNAELTCDETGLKFDNFIKDQQCVSYYRGGKFGEFKLSLLVNANLNVPAEGKAQWRYSEFYITFLIDESSDDSDLVAEIGKPWYKNNVYGSFVFGLTSGGTPISKFMYYNAFARNCSTSGQNYQDSGFTTVNVVDGKDHWIEIEIKNYETEEETGSRWTAYIDGVKVSEFDRADGLYYDSDTRRDYQVNYSSLKGGIGFYANTDWPSGYSPARMNNFLQIKKAKLVSYDDNPEGVVVDQCTAPVFKIKSKEFLAQASYETGDPIEIQLSDLFEYEGEEEVTYTATCNGEPIGQMVNGFWTWTPAKAGNYDIDVNAVISEDNKAVNYLTLRVTGEAKPTPDQSSSGTGTTDPAPSADKKGCRGSIGAEMLFVGMFAAVVFLKKRA